MRLTVLAAGVGSRLRPLTEERPKCLIELGDCTILDRLLGQADATGRFSEVVLVSGFRDDLLEDVAASWNRAHALPVRCVRNPDFSATNTLVSASLGVADAPGACVVVDGDLVLDREIVERVARCSGSALAVDSSRPLDTEAVKCQLDRVGRLEAISKVLDPASAQAESIGLCRLDGGDRSWFRRVATELISRGRVRDYYEAAFEVMLADGWRPDLLDIAGLGWEEIDDHDDLRRATALVTGDIDTGPSAPRASRRPPAGDRRAQFATASTGRPAPSRRARPGPTE